LHPHGKSWLRIPAHTAPPAGADEAEEVEMTRKQVSRKRKPPETPSTGQGADSALEAMIKRRATAPGSGNPPPPAPKKH
jgi:hypothetical protein